MKNLRNTIVTGLAVGIIGSTAAVAADWPQWGGNSLGRNMAAPGVTGLPDKVEPGDYKQGTEDVDLDLASLLCELILGSLYSGERVQCVEQSHRHRRR